MLMPRPKTKNLVKLVEKVQCEIFNQAYNPKQLRTGAKFLRKPLKGPTIRNYYNPPDFPTIKTLQAAFPQFKFYNEYEAKRLASIDSLKKRGKGAPKKKKGPPAPAQKQQNRKK